MTIRVLIVEDQRMIRELLAELLLHEPAVALVGQAGSGREALELARRVPAEVLLLDIGLPDMGGIEVAVALKKAHPELKIIALTVYDDPDHLRAMLDAGADGYVCKSSALNDLVPAIRAAAAGGIYLSPEIARLALAKRAAPTGAAPIGRRERQVLALIAEGKRSSEIASLLRISPATVEAHRRNIMRKLGLHTVAELTKYAVRQGLTSL
jgi:DNA-binding NarL/FixJ family response regulator